MSIKKLTADTVEFTTTQIFTRAQLEKAKAQNDLNNKPIDDMLAELDK